VLVGEEMGTDTITNDEHDPVEEGSRLI